LLNPQFKEGISNTGLGGEGEGVLWLDIVHILISNMGLRGEGEGVLWLDVVHMLKDMPGNSKGTGIRR
jgi:hypothetical protein